MAVKQVTRRGADVWMIELRYRGPDGKAVRYRRDAQVNTRAGAVAEEARLLRCLAATGEVPGIKARGCHARLRATLALAVAAAEWALVKALADALASGPAPAEEPLADALLLAAEAGRWDVARGLAPLVAAQLAKTRAPADPPLAGVVDIEAERRKRQ